MKYVAVGIFPPVHMMCCKTEYVLKMTYSLKYMEFVKKQIFEFWVRHVYFLKNFQKISLVEKKMKN